MSVCNFLPGWYRDKPSLALAIGYLLFAFAILIFNPYKKSRYDVYITQIMSSLAMVINLIILFLVSSRDFQMISKDTLDTIFALINGFLVVFVFSYYIYRRHFGLHWRVQWVVTSVFSERLKTRQASSQGGSENLRSADGRPRPGTTTKLIDPGFHMDMTKGIAMADAPPDMRWSPLSRHRTNSPAKSILRPSSLLGNRKNANSENHSGSKRNVSSPVRWADSRYVQSRELQNYSKTEVNNKLRAWYYRYSYIEKWQVAYRKVHGVIASQAERNNDPELVRNEMRLEHHTNELKQMGVSEPLKLFRERSLKPQPDMRLVTVPKKAKFMNFKEREYEIDDKDYTEVTTNLAMEWTKTPKDAVRFHTPDSKRRPNGIINSVL